MGWFNLEEKSVRKQWLIASIFTMLVWPLFNLCMKLYLMSQLVMPPMAYMMYVILFSAIFAGIIVLFFYLLYRCAYVKPGIRFLTFLLVVGPILKLSALGYVIRMGYPERLLGIGVDLCFYAWWYILSLKLRNFNRLGRVI